jgi:hypothetical protein
MAIDQAEKQHLIWDVANPLFNVAAAATVIAQTRAAHRFVFARVHGRVN